MKIQSFDHIVLCVADISETLKFYTDILGMEEREERPGKWSLHFGTQKISLQDAKTAPDIARDTTPGSGNFCLLTLTPIETVIAELEQAKIEIIAGPGERIGARSTIFSVYFKDPDGNLVEVSNQL